MAEDKDNAEVDVSVVMTVHNAAKWLQEALDSVLSQTFRGKMELSFFNDASTDSSLDILKAMMPRFEARNIKVVVGNNMHPEPKGVGYGINHAILQSTGKYLCFLDGDDVMAPDRVELQLSATMAHPNMIIGCCFTRKPEESTVRYTRWCNSITPEQLYTQAFTAFGPTIIKPTWLMTRDVYEKAGPFSEDGKGTPEDLIFFYKHLLAGGKLIRIDKPLLMYRYHPQCATHDVDRHTIWNLRVRAIQDFVLNKWEAFTIWNAGKQGRKLFRSLDPHNQAKVIAFCDVDAKKLALGHYTHEESTEIPKPKIPILHFTAAKPPFLLCIKWDMTGGDFEHNLQSLHLKEGEDYYHFS